jgi:hypothetical protein
MLSWILQITIISIILIFLIHHLFHFFKSTLTVPKIKDLVNSSNLKYENMYSIIKNNSENEHLKYKKHESTYNQENTYNQEYISNQEYTSIDLLPQPLSDKPSMKNELKNFIKKQLKSNENTNILNFDAETNSYLHY